MSASTPDSDVLNVELFRALHRKLEAAEPGAPVVLTPEEVQAVLMVFQMKERLHRRAQEAERELERGDAT